MGMIFHLGLLLNDGADAGREGSTPHTLVLVSPGCSQGCEFCAEGRQFGHPLVNDLDLCVNEAKDLTTRRRTFLLRREKSADLIERQTERFGTPDKAESLTIRFAIETIAGLAAACLGQQADFLVVADRLRVQGKTSRQFPNTYAITHHLTPFRMQNKGSSPLFAFPSHHITFVESNTHQVPCSVSGSPTEYRFGFDSPTRLVRLGFAGGAPV